MSTHTPGPWAIDGGSWKPWEGAIGIVNPNSAHRIAWTTSGELIPAEANAHLIAAAPDMLETLRTVLSSLEHLGMDAFADAPFLIRATRAAIAKAEGLIPMSQRLR